MKKNVLLIAILLLAVLSTRAQQLKWTFGPKTYDMSQPVPSLLSTNGSSYVQNVCYDMNGNVLFSIKDNGIYNSSDIYVSALPNYSTTSNDPWDCSLQVLTNPSIIIPVPGTCNKYYFIYTMTSGGQNCVLGSHGLSYIVIDMTSGNPAVDPNSVEINYPSGSTIDYGYRKPKSLPGTAFTISKTINSNSERYLFLISTINNSVYEGPIQLDKYLISTSGITFQSTLFQNSDDIQNPNAKYLNAQLALSPDQNYLAFGSGSNIYQIILSNYNLSSFDKIAIPGNLPVHSVCYDAGSSSIFCTTQGSASAIYYLTNVNGGLINSTSTVITTPSGTDFGYSNLERSPAGYIYTGDNSTYLQSQLYYIDPYASTPTINNTGITLANYPAASFLGFNMPIQISGDDYSNFTGVSLPVANFIINGMQSGNTPPQFADVFTCNPITLANLSTTPGIFLNNFYLQVQSCDVNGNVLTGTGYLDYNSGWRNANAINMKSMPRANNSFETWLGAASHIGYYKVTVKVKNACVVTVSKTMYIRLSSNPSASNVNLKIIQGGGATCKSQALPVGCNNTGIYSVGFNLGTPGTSASSNNIVNYSRKVEEVNCSTGAVISLLGQDASPIIPPDPYQPLYGINLNSIVINGTTGYFATNGASLFGKCYKLSVTVSNGCSNYTDWSYFKMAQNGYFYSPSDSTDLPQGNESTDMSGGISLPVNDKTLKLFPNPASGTINITSDIAQNLDAQIINAVGVKVMDIKIHKGTNTVNIQSLAKGLYFVKYDNGNNGFVQKLSVQ